MQINFNRFDFVLTLALAVCLAATGASLQEKKSQKKPAAPSSESPPKKKPAAKKAPAKEEAVMPAKKTDKAEVIQGLLSDVEKVDKSIEIVKEEIEQTREKAYLPTLYLRLAELYVEKSRLLYYKSREELSQTAKQPVQSGEIKEIKDLALETYKKILADYPDYPENVKVRFFMAHEYRELGDTDAMVDQYERIVNDYPESKYRAEALLLLGDYNFDRRRVSQAAEYYRRIISSNFDPNITNMARYKLAWCYINQDDFSPALRQFEDIARATKKDRIDREEDRLGKSSITREALIDSVLCYTETRKPEDAIPYYRELADSEVTYAKVLEKLANRYYIKKDLANSTKLYREILRVSGELEDNIEFVKRVLQFSRDVSNREQTLDDMDFLIRNLNRYLHSFRVNEEDKRLAYKQFEVFARDISTKLHLKADETKKAEYYDASAKAYKQYLTLFKDSAYAKEIQFNFAQTLYSSKKYLEAGEQYETLYKNTKDSKEKSEALYSAVAAYFDAIKDPKSMDKVQLIDARQGFIKTATQYIQEFPKSEKTAELRFAIGKTHYDLEEYDMAIQSFVKFINDYPDNKLTADAADLVLDCYEKRKDYKGLVEQGKMFLADKRIKDKKFLGETEDLVKKTEFVMIQEQAGKGKLAAEQGDFAKDFLQYSQKYKGTELGEKALYNAFQSYRKKNDRRLSYISGTTFLVQYPSSEYLKDVYPVLGTIAFEIADYDKACYYLESFQRKFPNEPKGYELLAKAAQIRTLLSDAREAIADYQKLLNSGRSSNQKEIYLKMAENYERMGNYSGMADSMAQAISLGEETIEAYSRLAWAQYKKRNFQAAQEAASDAMKTAESLGSARLSPQDSSRLAQAQFVMIEIKFANYTNITLAGKAANETKLVEKKNRQLQDLEKSLTDVSQYRDPKWIIATIFRIGQANADFADFLSKTSVPSNLSGDQKREYKKILGEKVSSLNKKAQETLRQALEKAYSLNIFNNWVKSCALGYYVKEDMRIRENIMIPAADKNQIEELYGRLLYEPDDTQALNKVALLYMRNQDAGIARMILNRSLEVKTSNASTLNNLGVAHWYMGEDQDAYSNFAKAITDNAGYAPSKINLAALYYDYGNRETASMSIRKLSGIEKVNFNAINIIPPAKKLLGR